MKKPIIRTIYVLTILFFFSCQKSIEPKTTSNNHIGLVRKITYTRENNTWTFSFAYTSDSLISAITQSDGLRMDFEYNTANQLVKVLYSSNGTGAFYRVYEYQAGLLLKTIAAFPIHNDTTFYTYNSANNLTGIAQYNLDGSVYYGEKNILYGSNETMGSYDEIDKTDNVTSYTYAYSLNDYNLCSTNNKLAFSEVSVNFYNHYYPVYDIFFPKEIVKISTKSEGLLSETQYSYEYNEQGYVSKIKSVGTSQDGIGGGNHLRIDEEIFEY